MHKQLWDGREYIEIYTAMDINGNKTAKVFFTNGTVEIIKDARLPLTCDRFYRSVAGLRRSTRTPREWSLLK
jgi:hypothetical protein